jgi:hypothetical protein
MEFFNFFDTLFSFNIVIEVIALYILFSLGYGVLYSSSLELATPPLLNSFLSFSLFFLILTFIFFGFDISMFSLDYNLYSFNQNIQKLPGTTYTHSVLCVLKKRRRRRKTVCFFFTSKIINLTKEREN